MTHVSAVVVVFSLLFFVCFVLSFCPAQVSTSSRAQSQMIKSLEAQVDDLSAHLRSFQDRDLPSPEEFRAELSRRERALAEQLRRAQEEESAWRRQAQAEREEMAKTAATKEAFVAKAVAIHVRLQHSGQQQRWPRRLQTESLTAVDSITRRGLRESR
jgi:hypothetical protein